MTKAQETQFLKEFAEGISKRQIAKDIGIDVTVLNRYIEENNLARSNNRVNKNIKSNYFSTIDAPEKAYWLGFLFTDGSVDHRQKTGRVRLQLQEQDKEILEQYKQDLGL